ncbi:hypothetical protein PR048_003386 [Dryococelus australis]|uniref:Uncharacterized protein n=1 Tax=Dryococelus australis TaxID=614101 RepID=A0ABQ9INV7_9NEOP|nr:hypothetical protein PR048_003386 [Dryococelus australis]
MSLPLNTHPASCSRLDARPVTTSARRSSGPAGSIAARHRHGGLAGTPVEQTTSPALARSPATRTHSRLTRHSTSPFSNYVPSRDDARRTEQFPHSRRSQHNPGITDRPRNSTSPCQIYAPRGVNNTQATTLELSNLIMQGVYITFPQLAHNTDTRESRGQAGKSIATRCDKESSFPTLQQSEGVSATDHRAASVSTAAPGRRQRRPSGQTRNHGRRPAPAAALRGERSVTVGRIRVLPSTVDRCTGIIGRGKRNIPEKTHRLTVSYGKISTCENPVTRPGVEPGSPWWEASMLTAQPQLVCVRWRNILEPRWRWRTDGMQTRGEGGLKNPGKTHRQWQQHRETNRSSFRGGRRIASSLYQRGPVHDDTAEFEYPDKTHQPPATSAKFSACETQGISSRKSNQMAIPETFWRPITTDLKIDALVCSSVSRKYSRTHKRSRRLHREPMPPVHASKMASPVIKMSERDSEMGMEQCGNARAGETGNPRENPPTSGVVRQRFAQAEIQGATPSKIEPGSSRWEASSITTTPPRSLYATQLNERLAPWQQTVNKQLVPTNGKCLAGGSRGRDVKVLSRRSRPPPLVFRSYSIAISYISPILRVRRKRLVCPSRRLSGSLWRQPTFTLILPVRGHTLVIYINMCNKATDLWSNDLSGNVSLDELPAEWELWRPIPGVVLSSIPI